jgi:hypothetical protein
MATTGAAAADLPAATKLAVERTRLAHEHADGVGANRDVTDLVRVHDLQRIP